MIVIDEAKLKKIGKNFKKSKKLAPRCFVWVFKNRFIVLMQIENYKLREKCPHCRAG